MYEDQLKKFEKLSEQAMQVYDFWIDCFLKSLKNFSK